jgi:hypothetical protein
MEVFVLMGEWNYEAHRVLGVYSSYEEAVVSHGAYVRNENRNFISHGVYVRDENRNFNDYYIERRVLGAVVDDSFNGDYIA